MKDKEIIVGVTGGIAVYKSADLVRLLVKAGANVKVAMTANSTRFVSPLTFEVLSGNEVISDMWNRKGTAVDHITWGQNADLIIIAPATADFIAKMANGIADDFLSTMVLAATAKILVCPSMNTQMYVNLATQENLTRLKGRGISVLEPVEGQLACGGEGQGRLSEPEDIMERALSALSTQDLSGLKILVTAGPTEEPLDPVRHITNRSSGKMGYAMARAARRRGASVVLVSGPTGLQCPEGVSIFRVRTARDMKEAVFENCDGCDIIIKAAAVSDYRPRDTSPHKIKKGEESISLPLVRNPDILAEVAARVDRSRCFIVGFAAETEDLLTNAKEKMKAKDMDMLVANNVLSEDSGFGSDTNTVKLISHERGAEDLPMMTKEQTADLILDRIRDIRETRLGPQGRA